MGEWDDYNADWERLYAVYLSEKPEQFYPNSSLHSETIATEDHLARTKLAEVLAGFLKNAGKRTEGQKTPQEHLTVGLFGDWGIGKTSFIDRVKAALPNKEKNDLPFIFGEFNAWSYEHCGNIQAGLAQEFVNSCTKDIGWWGKLCLMLCFGWKRHRAKLVTLSLSVVFYLLYILGFLFHEWVQAQSFFSVWAERLAHLIGIFALVPGWLSLKSVMAHPFAKNLHTYLRLPDFSPDIGKLPVMREDMKALAQLRLGTKRRLLFVVDDLDRCSPDGIVRTLEAVRLAMDLQQVIVVIAIDHRIALAALAQHYESTSAYYASSETAVDLARDYLGKIIHLPITLQAPEPQVVEYFLKNALWHDPNTRKDSEDRSVKDTSSSAENIQKETDLVSPEGVLAEDGKAKESNHVIQSSEPSKEGLNTEQKKQFITLVKALKLSNPRQLKRLNNAYDVIRHCFPEEDTEKAYPRLTMLLLREAFKQDCFDKCTESLKRYKELAEAVNRINNSEREQYFQQVSAFTLPTLGKSNSENKKPV